MTVMSTTDTTAKDHSIIGTTALGTRPTGKVDDFGSVLNLLSCSVGI